MAAELAPTRPYLIYSSSSGAFSEIDERLGRDIPMRLLLRGEGREAGDPPRLRARPPKTLQFFSEKIGVAYPYEHYSQVAVSEFPGGMEHTTCTTQTDAALMDARAALDTDFDGLVSHELAHQWFGDLLTCKDWSHAWLNEGFATYFEVLFQHHDKGQDEAEYELYSQRPATISSEDARPLPSPRSSPARLHEYPWDHLRSPPLREGALLPSPAAATICGDELWWKSIGHYLAQAHGRVGPDAGPRSSP